MKSATEIGSLGKYGKVKCYSYWMCHFSSAILRNEIILWKVLIKWKSASINGLSNLEFTYSSVFLVVTAKYMKVEKLLDVSF